MQVCKQTGLNHQVRGLTASDFRKISVNGFGDSYNAYPHSMAWFRNRLYVGTTRACLAYRGQFFAESDPTQLGEIWPVPIPEGAYDIDLRAEIWCYDPQGQEWTRVYQSPMVMGIGGFEVPLSLGFRAMVVYQGQDDLEPVLYVPTWGTRQTPEAVMLRSLDGQNWQVVSDPGLGFPDPFKPRAVRCLLVFKGWLFSSPAVGQKRGQPNTSGVGVVLCTKNPAGGRWEIASEPFLGNPNNLTVFQMASFNDHLYVGTLNINEGFEIWKTRGEGTPPFQWQRVIRYGAYRGRNNQIAITLYPFQGCLYVGTAVQTGGFDRENHVGPTAAEIIRIHPDDTWDLVVGDARLTPGGLQIPISGHTAGFNNPFAGYLWCMCEHEGWLYAGTFDSTTFLRYAAFGDRVPKWLSRVHANLDVERLVGTRGGFSLWRTRDGLRWKPVSLNGFGNPYNYGVRTMLSTEYGLFLGAANPYGPEVAVRRTAGWRYEGNPHGGLEIWLGARRETYLKGCDATIRPSSHWIASSPELCWRVAQEVREECHRFVDELYRGCGFHHYGFWKYDTPDLQAACLSLMDEILALVQNKSGKVLDLFCGTGASTAHMARALPFASVLGVHGRFGAVRRNRKAWPSVSFCWGFPGFWKRWENSMDLVVCVRGLHSAPRRDRIWRMAWHVLRPGGQFVGFEHFPRVVKERHGISVWKKYVHFQSTLQFKEKLERVGFSRTSVHEVTEATCKRFSEYVGRVLLVKELEGNLEANAINFLMSHHVQGTDNLKSIIFSCWKDPS